MKKRTPDGDGGLVVHSVIGAETEFRGDLSVKGLLRIDGDFRGSIRTDGQVLVGRSGRVDSSISAKTVVVGGVVKGDIVSCGKVAILSTGVVIGSIRAQRLIAEEDVIISGRCTIGTEETSMSPLETKQKKSSLDSSSFLPRLAVTTPESGE